MKEISLNIHETLRNKVNLPIGILLFDTQLYMRLDTKFLSQLMSQINIQLYETLNENMPLVESVRSPK